MDSEEKNGKMAHFMKVSSKMGKRVGKDSINGETKALTMAHGKITVLMALVLTYGLMVVSIWASGK